jgi:hypothetical protein
MHYRSRRIACVARSGTEEVDMEFGPFVVGNARNLARVKQPKRFSVLERGWQPGVEELT